MKFDIIFEDNHLLVINKPFGMLSQDDRTKDETVLDICKAYIKVKYNKPGNVFLAPAHRLDRPVSGCLILGKTSKALSRLHESFKTHKVEKTYIAISHQTPEKDQGILENYLLKDSKTNITKVVSEGTLGSKRAQLNYKNISSDSGYCLLKVEPQTGRSHQIRVQLSGNKSPIVGDVKYGGIKWDNKNAIALHCIRMKLIHPVTKEEVILKSLPDFKLTWSKFKRKIISI